MHKEDLLTVCSCVVIEPELMLFASNALFIAVCLPRPLALISGLVASNSWTTDDYVQLPKHEFTKLLDRAN